MIDVCNIALQGLSALRRQQEDYPYEDYEVKRRMIADTEQKIDFVRNIKKQLGAQDGTN